MNDTPGLLICTLEKFQVLQTLSFYIAENSWVYSPKHDLQCTVTSCNVHAEPLLVVTWDVSECGAFCSLQSATTILHVLLAIMKEMKIDIRNLLSFGESYDSVAQKWTILAILGELLGRYWDLKQCLKAKILRLSTSIY